jgi:hypothetical protein
MQQANNPRQFSVWSAMVLAPFFAFNLYRDVGRNWRGIGLRLILLVLLITWTAEGITLHRSFNKFAKEEFPTFVQDVPPITIKDGVVSSPVEQPYYIKDKQGGKTFAVIDTTGTITSLDQTDGAIMLLTDTKLHYRDNNNPGQVKIQDLSQVKNFYVDKDIINSWVMWGAKWAAWVLIPLVFVFSFIYRLIQGLIYALIGLIWNNVFNANLSFGALMRLAFVAVTPVILADTALSLAHVNVPAWWLLCFVIAMIYLAVGVKANEQAPAYPMQGQGFPPYPPQQQQQSPYGAQPQYPYQQPFPPNPPPPPRP